MMTPTEILIRDGYIVAWTEDDRPEPGDIREITSEGDPLIGSRIVVVGPATFEEWERQQTDMGNPGQYIYPWVEFYKAVAE
jgi:hypothetical protein